MKLFLLVILAFSINVYGQNCGFEIDKEKILRNEDLDFFLEKIEKEKFEITNRKETIPKSILNQLECLNEEFTIANPSEEYQNSDMVDEGKKLADRGLVFLAKSEKTLIIYYGISSGPGISSKYLFVSFDQKGINKLWCGNGIGVATNMKTLKNVTERIKLYRDKTFGLQTGIVTF